MRCKGHPPRCCCCVQYHGGLTELLSEPASDDPVSLSDMTKAELLAYAEEHGIAGVSSSMLKADIYAAIVAAM